MDLSLPMLKIAIEYDVEPGGLLECEETSEEVNNIAFQHGF
jgi:hypothetical protein